MTAAWPPDPSPGHEGTSPAGQRAPNRRVATGRTGGEPLSTAPPARRAADQHWSPPNRAEALAAQAARLPAVALDGRALADLECLAVGAFSPLTGFLGAADHTAVVEQGGWPTARSGPSQSPLPSRPRYWPPARTAWP